MPHGGSNSAVVSHRLPRWHGNPQRQSYAWFSTLLAPERAAHAMRHQPTLPHLHSHFSLPSRLSLLMGFLIQRAHNCLCVLTSLLKSCKLHLSSGYVSESVQLTSNSALVILYEST